MGEFDAAAQEHGLATTGGRVSTTGVAGFTLGGGSGWLERKHGLACDNLIGVDLVTADGGRCVRTSRRTPDLFWALHGGGGNFGVATSFEFRLHAGRADPDVRSDGVAGRGRGGRREGIPRPGRPTLRTSWDPAWCC